MASSSSRHNWNFDVFLSFRGADTRKNFTDHLYFALRDAGINTFKDDNELRRGEDLTSELLQAIQGSRISVVVFSRTYAASRWCLEELVKIMECRRTVRQLVLPIFYDVDASDVRHQTGSFAEAFAKHEKRYLSDIDKVLKWRKALIEAANLSGWDLRNTADGHEAKFIRKIVAEISRELNSTYLFVALYPVGLDSRVQDVTSLLCVGGDDVRMVGIWGMSGMGKTTIAKAIYNKFYHSFEGKSFLANVGVTSEQPDGLVRVQNQLLSDILKASKVRVCNGDEGITVIQERLCGRRVLVIIDGVDQLEQLNALARSRNWFGSGSRIIITTRDEHLLKGIGVDGVYTAKEMNVSESLELFSWHAFRNSYPTENFMGLSRSVVAYSGGLPIALEVLGSFLFSRSMLEWESALEKLKRIPHDQIQKKLRISFDALGDNTVKDIFLDISCFFIGMDKENVVQILDGCGLFAKIGISVLIQRCLLTVGQRNKLSMHDLLRDMGREIVREKCPNEPGRWSRLWLHEEASNILRKHEGTEAVEGLTLKSPRLSRVNFSTKAFVMMQRLRLLQLDHAQLTGDYEYLSKELRWLSWHGLPLKFMPKTFYLGHLVAMDLRYSSLRQVWKDPKQVLEKLKILNLGHSHYLTKTPEFSSLPNLEKLILKDCTSLYEVHQSIGDLNNLVLANLKDCKSLRSLPRSFYKLKYLQTLILSGCSRFDALADDLGSMESLTTFLADNTAIRQVPVSIVHLRNLKHLSLCGCKVSTSKSLPSLFWSWISPGRSPKSVNLLPASLQGLNSLKTLSLRYCNLSDDAIPKDLGSLSSLQTLELDGNSFSNLPSTLGGLLKLQSLSLNYCTNLQSLPNLPTSLKQIYAMNCTAMESMPNLSKISNMEALHLTNCHKLVEIPGLDKLLKSFRVIHLEGCNNVTSTFKESLLQEWAMSGFGGIFGMFLPGNDIPDWFTFKDEGSSICFEVPSITDKNLEGLAICVVYSSCIDQIVSQELTSITVINYTKNIIQTSRPATIDVVISDEDHLWQGNVSKRKFNLEEGDQVELIADFGSGIDVKKIGVSPLYDGKIIHFDSTPNEEDSIVADDDHHENAFYDHVGIKPKRGFQDDTAESSQGGWFDEDRQPKRLKCEHDAEMRTDDE
ncbi:hypothetical protein F2P56_002465 [Juglans regia]|uniref:ADP-ribosyl cyclase/cyclic ADP-ribose hydrolase n=2 Tax=Juglans regia TaxID=51240 RepID=A0A2I4GP50_JUGRE|nr:disease resistance protein RUN1-like isoform X1 [Juglans regia]KAF5481845.1 hypothetical protein F2P56_002465 [Juglans regia]